MLKEIKVDSSEWNKIVKGFKDYDVFYLSEYAKAFQMQGYGTPVLLFFEQDEDRAINVVFKRAISNGNNYLTDKRFEGKEFFDLSSPYGYGGFCGSVKDYTRLNREYNNYCYEKGYICEFVRFNLFSDYWKNYDGSVEMKMHNVVRSLDLSLDFIWKDFKAKVRKNVNRAIQNGLTVICDSENKYLEDFLNIYYSTMDRSNANKNYYFPKEFFNNINTMCENIMYFHAMYENKIISTELVLFGKENCYSFLGGTNQEYFHLRPNDILKYEIIKWAKVKGLKNFVLGGGYGEDDGIFRYKESLSPNGIVDFYVGKKIFYKDTYDMICKLRNCENSNDYFPAYRRNERG